MRKIGFKSIDATGTILHGVSSKHRELQWDANKTQCQSNT
jgi:hypothetical protein